MWITLWITVLQGHVDKLWITLLHFLKLSLKMLSTAYPQLKMCAALPSTPTMFEHECIITRFGHGVKRLCKDLAAHVGIFLA